MEYKIISIEENNGGSEGRVIIVKANPAKEDSTLARISKMFGKKYFRYSSTLSDETETFIFPFSEKNKEYLMKCAIASDQNECLWNPNHNDFFDSGILQPSGEIANVKKHISFKSQTAAPMSGIQDIINDFRFSESLKDLYKGGKGLTDVKGVSLNDGSTYSGKALYNGSICIANGYGRKKYKEKGNFEITSFYRGGNPGNIVWFVYPHKYLYAGGVIENETNGWGIKIAKGQFTFGYYKKGKLYKDMSPFATDIFYKAKDKDMKISPVEDEICRIAVGVQPTVQSPFLGLYFLENGSVYLGEGTVKNSHSLTGRFIKLDIDGIASFGIFKDGILTKSMSQKEFFEKYGEKSDGQERTDTSTNYLAQPDSGKFFITNMLTKFDFDMGSLIIICAVPLEKMNLLPDGKIQYDIRFTEYFCLRRDEDDSLAMLIRQNAEQHKLWLVNLDDFNTHFGGINDFSEDKEVNKNYHLHNAIIGLEYTNVARFDTKHIIERIEEKTAI